MTTNKEEKKECDIVNSIDKYIEKIREKHKNHSQSKIVYRGEIKDYKEYCCRPNVFREPAFYLNKYYEKNILDEMTALNINNGDNYLFKAINAQHGGFPSRLLDVTFNALVALHFAINPHYTKAWSEKIKEFDKEDGVVYVFFFNEMYCATSDIIQNSYNAIINRDENYFIDSFIFSQNYKLIDHIKLNDRIIAQNGGFILFPGNEFHPVPDWMFEKIIIPAGCKERIRKELKELFGIDNGTMYPEVSNQVPFITDKSSYINNSEYSNEQEISLFISFLDNECEGFINKNFYSAKKYEINSIITHYRDFEKKLKLYATQFEKVYECITKNNKNGGSVKYKTMFNNIIYEFQKQVKYLTKKNSMREIEILLLEGVTNEKQ